MPSAVWSSFPAGSLEPVWSKAPAGSLVPSGPRSRARRLVSRLLPSVAVWFRPFPVWFRLVLSGLVSVYSGLVWARLLSSGLALVSPGLVWSAEPSSTQFLISFPFPSWPGSVCCGTPPGTQMHGYP